MQLQILSDLHLEFHSDLGKSFADSLNSTGVDVLVIAGDLIPLSRYYDYVEEFFNTVCNKYKDVIYVLGNHEFYHSSPVLTSKAIMKLRNEFNNLHHLDVGTRMHLGGEIFTGGTLWFSESPDDILWKKFMSDFKVIKDFEPWVYQENAETVKNLEIYMESNDIVITHHLPSYKSVHSKYISSGLNRFFVCEMDELILERKPKLWIHGHSHSPSNYMLGDTRIVCNPHGYIGEKGTSFNERLIIEV